MERLISLRTVSSFEKDFLIFFNSKHVSAIFLPVLLLFYFWSVCFLI